jgi:hypothetical protein
MAIMMVVAPGAAKVTGYRMARSVVQAWMNSRTNTVLLYSSEHFDIYGTEAVGKWAKATDDLAEQAWDALSRLTAVPDITPIRIYLWGSEAQLAGALGEKSIDAIGVYEMGAVHIVAPSAWVSYGDGVKMTDEVVDAAYRAQGPVLHELTHLFVDYVGQGNYPRWFSEGLAQYMESEQLKLAWAEPDIKAGGLTLYSLADLERRFDDLPNQDMAYWESRQMVSFWISKYGWNTVNSYLVNAGKGLSFDTSLERSIGLSEAQLFGEFAAANSD